MNSFKNVNRSHNKNSPSFESAFLATKQTIISRGDLPHVSVEKQLELLQELSQFPFGRFLLEHRGANGFWTDYLLNYPNHGRLTGLNIEGVPPSSIEDFLLNRSPMTLATQQRFQIFQHLIQALLKDGTVIASIPCGIMRDLLTLDYSAISTFKLIGIDIDNESLQLAKNLAKAKQIDTVDFSQNDAWNLAITEELDILTSNGLNVYEPSHEKVLELYSQFYRALKPGGHLVIGVLTYPPGNGRKTDWDTNKISDEDLYMEQVLLEDILDLKWRNFRSINELEDDFKTTGFSKIDVHFDKHRIFPTIVAQK